MIVRARSLRAALAAGLVTAVAVAAPAAAHAELVGSDPEAGSVVRDPVRSVLLVFDSLLASGGAQIVVTGPDGAEVTRGGTVVEGRTARVAVGPLEATGRYRIAYRVAAWDDHPETRELTFTTSPSALVAGRVPEAVLPAPVPAPRPRAGLSPAWVAFVLALVGTSVSGLLRLSVLRRGGPRGSR